MILTDVLPDLCQACQNDLERWYAEGGGERSDVSHNGPGDGEDTDE